CSTFSALAGAMSRTPRYHRLGEFLRLKDAGIHWQGTQAVTLSQKGEKKSSGTFSDQFHRCKGPWPTRRLRLLDLLTLSARKRRCGI
ncbi:unnamed protein product, partial [Cladocopium goreaui]